MHTVIRVSVKELLLAYESGALGKLMQQDIPVAGTWKLARLIRRIDSEYKDASAAKLKLFTDEMSSEVSPGVRTIKPDRIEEFNTNPLFSKVIEIDADQLTWEDLAGAKLSAADLINLGPLVREQP
jgi:hypothetical protein